jgi:hypothetical protein
LEFLERILAHSREAGIAQKSGIEQKGLLDPRFLRPLHLPDVEWTGRMGSKGAYIIPKMKTSFRKGGYPSRKNPSL